MPKKKQPEKKPATTFSVPPMTMQVAGYDYTVLVIDNTDANVGLQLDLRSRTICVSEFVLMSTLTRAVAEIEAFHAKEDGKSKFDGNSKRLKEAYEIGSLTLGNVRYPIRVTAGYLMVNGTQSSCLIDHDVRAIEIPQVGQFDVGKVLEHAVANIWEHVSKTIIAKASPAEATAGRMEAA